MSDELNFLYEAGNTLEAEVFGPGWVSQAAAVSMTEISAGRYSADMPVSITTPGCYTVEFVDTVAGQTIGRGEILWDGSEEICQADANVNATRLKEMWQMRGLDPAYPCTNRQDKIFVGPEGSEEYEVILTGNGRDEKVATRTP